MVREFLSRGVEPTRLIWMRLDHPMLMNQNLGELVKHQMATTKASEAHPLFLFMDELTYAADWDLWLKTFYDERWPVRVVATSSSTATLRTRRRESGVGRWEEHYMTPWLFSEYLNLKGMPHSNLTDSIPWDSLRNAAMRPPTPQEVSDARRRYLLLGGFPELLDLEEADEETEVLRSQRVLRSDAVERAVYKDIPQAFGVQEPMKLERLLYILAGQVGGIFSPASLRSDLGLTAPTLDKYVNYLEQSFLLMLIPNYSPAEESIQRRGRKVYFVDGAVRNAALLRGLAPAKDSSEMGVLYENAAAAHLDACARQIGGRLFYWRDGRTEVDFILQWGQEVAAFEVASSARHSTKGLVALAKKHAAFEGRCFLISPNEVSRMPDEARPGHLPIDSFLEATSQIAEIGLRRKFVG